MPNGEERIKELLGVLNYTASPFGTEEANLCADGEEGKHYVKEASGAPKLTALGTKRLPTPTSSSAAGRR